MPKNMLAFSPEAVKVLLQALKVYRNGINKESMYGQLALELMESFAAMQIRLENE